MALLIDDGILITADLLPADFEAPAPPQEILGIENIPQDRAAWCLCCLRGNDLALLWNR